MRIDVYFETNSTAILVACFIDDELYNACLPILEEEAGKVGMIVTESCFEDEEVTDEGE
jgi:hypothetical protein